MAEKTRSARKRTGGSATALTPPSNSPPLGPLGYSGGMTGDSSGAPPPPMAADEGTLFRNLGSSGLKQYGGYVREEFLPQLSGLQAARIFREMADNSPIIGGLLFAIRGVMRKVQWRVQEADDSPQAMEYRDFVDSIMHDMSDTWENFINEALSMLPFGFAAHEINYKRRLGPKMESDKDEQGKTIPGSKFDDGKLGWRSLPLRGQDTIVKWFFDDEARIIGLTQQPWQGSWIDIPIEKLLLFRPSSYKGNPEGRSIIRTAYRSWYFIKRLEEQEAITFERLGGFPVLRIPGSVIAAADGGDPVATKTLRVYQNIGKNIRIDEQMYILLPSDTMPGTQGPSAQYLYDFKLETPQGGNRSVSADTTIQRHTNDILMSVMADFLTLGHSTRGTQSLAVTKVDLFLQACEGWLDSIGADINRHGLPRLWHLNADDIELIPTIEPDMASQLDPASLGALLLALSSAGMPLFPDPKLENWVRDNMGMPAIPDEDPTARPPPFTPLVQPALPDPGTPEHEALKKQVDWFQAAAAKMARDRSIDRARKARRPVNPRLLRQ